jgi:hypothetical protein
MRATEERRAYIIRPAETVQLALELRSFADAENPELDFKFIPIGTVEIASLFTCRSMNLFQASDGLISTYLGQRPGDSLTALARGEIDFGFALTQIQKCTNMAQLANWRNW